MVGSRKLAVRRLLSRGAASFPGAGVGPRFSKGSRWTRLIGDVGFKLRAGEVLKIAGVIGSGREVLTRTLAGFAPHDGGRFKIGDREVTLTTPAEAADLGIGYVPRERRVEGLVLFLPVSANITLADLASLTRYGLIDAREERRRAKTWIDRLKIRTPKISIHSASTSRGAINKKVVLAKWLNAKVKILILDHPTRGLDVGAKEEVYELIRAHYRRRLGDRADLGHSGRNNRF